MLESTATASRNFTHNEVDAFLRSGWLIGLDRGEALISWGRSKRSAKPIPASLQHYSSDFYGDEKAPWLSFEHSARVATHELLALLEDCACSPPLHFHFREPEFDDFDRRFASIQDAIARNEIDKAVPVVFATAAATMTKAMRAHCIRQSLLHLHEQTPYAYLSPSSGIIGATPETLFSFDSGARTLHSMALAGTRATSEERAHSMLNDDKERLEHELVTRGLREKLRTRGEVEISNPRVWEIGPLAHLRSDVRLVLPNNSAAPEGLFSEMVALLHPTPALGVAPVSVDWRRCLRALDGPVERQRFGAPYGVVDPDGRTHALVAIRNVQWNEHGQVLIGSGCGVVKGSDVEQEWQEMQLKRRSVRALLGL
jgi:isochorismate synthase EntC